MRCYVGKIDNFCRLCICRKTMRPIRGTFLVRWYSLFWAPCGRSPHTILWYYYYVIVVSSVILDEHTTMIFSSLNSSLQSEQN